MKIFIKKLIACFFVFCFVSLPAFGKINTKATINHAFSVNDIPEELYVLISEDIELPDKTIIPKHSILNVETLQVQKERRWHKSAFIIGKIKNYVVQDIDTEKLYEAYEKELYRADLHENSLAEYVEQQTEIFPIKKENIHDVSDKNMYVKIYKYWALDKKEAAILTTEIIITQAASIVGSCFIFFAPVDIAYFFTKGAIQREKHPNWFKAGVFNAYDNSIFWFWLKGRPIELEENSPVKIKNIDEKKALKIKSKIDKKYNKKEIKEAKKQVKKHKKTLAKAIKRENKDRKSAIKEVAQK